MRCACCILAQLYADSNNSSMLAGDLAGIALWRTLATACARTDVANRCGVGAFWHSPFQAWLCSQLACLYLRRDACRDGLSGAACLLPSCSMCQHVLAAPVVVPDPELCKLLQGWKSPALACQRLMFCTLALNNTPALRSCCGAMPGCCSQPAASSACQHQHEHQLALFGCFRCCWCC